MVARQQGRELAAVATAASAEVVSASSLKAALDLDWDEPQARQQALGQVRAALDAVERWLTTQGEAAQDPSVVASMAAARQVQAQDVDAQAEGGPPLWRAFGGRLFHISLHSKACCWNVITSTPPGISGQGSGTKRCGRGRLPVVL